MTMARSPQQKLKLLRLMQILLRQSDEGHPMTVAQMIEALAGYGISAERKSIYDDLEALRLFGLDIVQAKSKTTGYYVGAREFELPELKLLVDSVQSSRFITQRKTLSLIRKIEALASVYDAQLLQRQVYVCGRVKTMNESVYYNVDEISNAINAGRAIHFRYFEYTPAKERRFRREGAVYEVSPFALMWDDENYYLIGWDHGGRMIKHYRVDKMSGISVTGLPRQGAEDFARLPAAHYSGHVFNMFTGQMERVQMRFAAHLAGAVMDRFGKEAPFRLLEDGSFTVTVEVAVSPRFYAWIFGFGPDAQILAPAKVREGMARLLAQVAGLYEKKEGTL